MWKSIGCGIFILIMMTGCFSDPTTAEKTEVFVQPIVVEYDNNKEAFGYLADQFKKINSFTKEESYTLSTTEGSLLNEFMYLQEITTVAGSVPYYEYIASYNRIKRNVKRMRNILDKYIDEYPQSTRIIYGMTKGNITIIFKSMDISIAQAKEGIDANTMSSVIAQFTQLYGAVKPLISTATVAAVL